MATSRDRFRPAISTSSLADIAFLLLIFFLVVTRIEVEQGIPVKLPRWDPDQHTERVPERDVLRLQLNAQDELLVEGNLMEVADLKTFARKFVDNRGADPNHSRSPRHAVISLVSERNTSYNAYLQVYNEIRATYRELREEWAQSRYGKTISELEERNTQAFEEVHEEYPIRFSEQVAEQAGITPK